MADPVRDGVRQLINLLHQAGIKTVMITGDQSATAYAIGKELGLSGNSHIEMLDSTRLEKLEPEVLSALAPNVDIFSRVSPAHKLQIVRLLQESGKVVAMTGDGINDGPALKAAEVGIAMGANGTEAARSVADIVLENDDLQTLIVAVGQGRTIYNNIRKSVHFLLSTNLSEIMTCSPMSSLPWRCPSNQWNLMCCSNRRTIQMHQLSVTRTSNVMVLNPLLSLRERWQATPMVLRVTALVHKQAQSRS
jgi:magnesium-transporting ATPase (P-type)